MGLLIQFFVFCIFTLSFVVNYSLGGDAIGSSAVRDISDVEKTIAVGIEASQIFDGK